MKFLIVGLPISTIGMFLNLYFESSSNTLNMELSGVTGRKGAQRKDFTIDPTWNKILMGHKRGFHSQN